MTAKLCLFYFKFGIFGITGVALQPKGSPQYSRLMSVLYGAFIIFVGCLLLSALIVGAFFAYDHTRNEPDEIEPDEIDEHDPDFTVELPVDNLNPYADMQDVTEDDLERARRRIAAKQHQNANLTIA